MNVVEVYNQLVNNHKSIPELSKIYHKRSQYIRNQLYSAYGKSTIKSITKSIQIERMVKTNTGVKRGPRDPKIVEKIRKANIESWKNNDEMKKKSRENMIKYCAPKSQTESAKEKRVISRKKNNDEWHTDEIKRKISNSAKGRIASHQTRAKQSVSAIKRGVNFPIGWGHSQKTKDKLSEITKKQWEIGIHKPTFKSKGHIEVEHILTELGYDIVSEYFIKGRPYDIFVKSLNLIIEYNGTYWHYDSRVFDENYFDKSKNRYVKDVWEHDKHKIQTAINSGYCILVIWQFDFESLDDVGKIKFIKNKINEYKI